MISLPLLLRVSFRAAAYVKNGATNSSKKGTASLTGLLLNEMSALAARGVSGKRLVMSSWSSAPQLWPTPTTGRGP